MWIVPEAGLLHHLHLPNMHSFSLDAFKDVLTYLPHFNFPSLRSLRLTSRAPLRPRPLHRLSDLIAQSSCRLQSLELSQAYLSDNNFTDYIMLPCLQDIKELTINHLNGVSDATVKLLQFPVRDKGSGYMPQLERLTVNA